MSNKITDFAPAARWTPDCNGKQDYDGRLLSISTRFWPAWKSSVGRPSAHAAILIDHTVLYDNPDRTDEWESDYATLSEAEFAADTDDAVKLQVEEWVRSECVRILTALGVSALHGDSFGDRTAEVSR
jgi:hypothetical protein